MPRQPALRSIVLLAALQGGVTPALPWQTSDLVGTTSCQRCLDCSESLGWPADVQDIFGTMIMRTLGGPQSFAVYGFRRPDGWTFLRFDLIANSKDGRTCNRVLGVLDTTGRAVIHRSANGPEILAVLTPEELAAVERQPIHATAGQLATLRNPSNACRMNTSMLFIEPIVGDGLECVGFPRR